ncbi:aldehyde dehydrogenase family protein [Schaalia sp. 19OD2882]|uniref:succinic semialdehyde dehydrogenase n=1 Tax=Schaalia sp. 19OD2882 TaxID=2794089 RepID=UPI001C1F139F|nr:succinic semialdehyde dehydrogenase [Schaalia sp. 19OD2882]QWW20236.1 aldehyde dehydrogenase family protein [Schaalia sp. 19OD2882]
MTREVMDARGRNALRILGATWPPEGALAAAGRPFDEDWAGAAGRTVQVSSPLTGAPIGQVPALGRHEVAGAALAARRAGALWASRPLRERTRVLLAFHDLVWKHRDALLDLVQWESGKARAHAFEEVADVAITARHLAHTAASRLRSERRTGVIPVLTRTEVHHHPKGVVGIIAPWNYPLILTACDAMAALVAGNAVILKPDSATPFTALAVASLFHRAGLPSEVFQVLPGSGSVVGSAIVDEADAVMFTGSSPTGARVAARAAARLVAASAELGGKNPMVVRADAPVERTVRGAVKACFANSGQLCVSIERIYVNAQVWDRFVPAFVEAAGRVGVRATMEWTTAIGPLITSAHARRVDAHVRDAVAKGARVLTGGSFCPQASPDPSDPSAYLPTVLTDVTSAMEVFAEETFGPVVSVYRVADDEEALRLANASPYGLNASVWSANATAARALARRIRCGTVNVNEGYAATWASPGAEMGGRGRSGLGRRHGREGLLKYTETQSVSTQRLFGLQAPLGMGEEAWAHLMGTWLQVARHLPFLDR